MVITLKPKPTNPNEICLKRSITKKATPSLVKCEGFVHTVFFDYNDDVVHREFIKR